MTPPATALPVEAPQAFLGVARSLTDKLWRDRLDARRAAKALAIVQQHQLPELLARVLAGRGVDTDAVADFLDPTIRKLMPDPFTVTEMEAAAKRIADAAANGEKIAIFGDYDVDGATSAALLTWHLRHCGLDPLIHIPDRIFEGYGPNVEAVRGLAAKGATLLVTVDCGTTSIEPLAEAKRLGMSVVVIDHHQAGDVLPEVDALVNPNRLDDLSGLGHLAAVGLVLVTLVAVNRELRRRGFWSAGLPEPDLLGMLHHVALGTVADVAPLIGLNRAFVAKGLIAMRRRDHVGHTALMDVSRLNGPPEAWHLGFMLGPRINAGGRIGRADLGVRLLLEGDSVEAARIAAELDRLNSERRVIEQGAEAQAEAEALASIGFEDKLGIIVTASEGWHPGVVGLVASRLKEKFLATRLRDRAGARRHRYRLGSLDRRRRHRQGGSAGSDRWYSAQGRRPRDGCGRDAAEGEARRIPRLPRECVGTRCCRGPPRQRALHRRRGLRARGDDGACRHAQPCRSLRQRQSGSRAGAAGASARLCRRGRTGAFEAALQVGRRCYRQRHRVPFDRTEARQRACCQSAASNCMSRDHCRSIATRARSACNSASSTSRYPTKGHP
ncbi:hypothetical protein ACVWW4_001144 [Bradyrhizobium sp. LB7.1]